MKKVTTILAVILLAAVSMTAQTLSYSAVVRNSDNELVVNENLTVAISIANSNGGAAVYSETHNVTTNQNGLVTLMIGAGTNPTGSMSDVTWPTAYITSDYTLPNGSHVLNTTPVTAVPYALYAEKSGSSATGSTGSAHVSGGNVTVTMPISDFVNNLTDAEKAELCAALGCSGGGGEPGTDPTGFTCGSSKMVDADGNEYETVKMGVLGSDGVDYGSYYCVTKSNLRTKKYYDSEGNAQDMSSLTDLLAAGDPMQLIRPSYYIIPNTTVGGVNHTYPAETYGYLYNYGAAISICPRGWHLLDNSEWTSITNYIKNKESYVCGTDNNYIAQALASQNGWPSSNVECAVGYAPSSNNATGFSAYPAGLYSLTTAGVEIVSTGSAAAFWGTFLSSGLGWMVLIGLNSDSPGFGVIGPTNHVLENGASVRCVRNY